MIENSHDYRRFWSYRKLELYRPALMMLLETLGEGIENYRWCVQNYYRKHQELWLLRFFSLILTIVFQCEPEYSHSLWEFWQNMSRVAKSSWFSRNSPRELWKHRDLSPRATATRALSRERKVPRALAEIIDSSTPSPSRPAIRITFPLTRWRKYELDLYIHIYYIYICWRHFLLFRHSE